MPPHGIRRILAPNPGPLTGPGTNTYILADGAVVVDPGPKEPAHLDAILRASDRIEAILVTHAHRDHSELAAPLSERSGAPVLAFGPPTAGRSSVMRSLSGLGGGEGLDASFRPDRGLVDGEVISFGSTAITALHTPGHFGGHLSFQIGDTILSGDLVMGWSTTLISPPDGDVAAFRASCARLLDLHPSILLPGHGDPVADPKERIAELLAHREMRERQIVAALSDAPGTASDLAARIYTDVAPALLPAAARNVLAHLIDLTERGRAVAPRGISEHAVFHPA